MSRWIYSEEIRRSQQERDLLARRVRSRLEELHANEVDLGGFGVYAGLDKHSWQVAQGTN
jgi:hypothetical protein